MSEKTNVMRILDSKKIAYEAHSYDNADGLTGAELADALGLQKERMFKTLVTVGKSNRNYVFVVPVAEELDLDKAARAVGEKAVHMLKSKELLPLTGYVHGGCSPIGMKKPFPTVVDETALLSDRIIFSAGKIGYQVELPLSELQRVVKLTTADLTKTGE